MATWTVPGGVADAEEARQPPAFGFVAVHRKRLEVRPPGCVTWYTQPPSEPMIPCVDDVEDQRRVHGYRRMQTARRLPRPIPDAGHVLARSSRRMERHTPAVARHDMPRSGHSAHLDLEALDRRIHVPHSAARCLLLPGHVPGLECLPQLHVHTAPRDRTVRRESEFQMRREPLGLQRLAGALQVVQYIVEILGDEVGQHEAIVQLGAPPRERSA